MDNGENAKTHGIEERGKKLARLRKINQRIAWALLFLSGALILDAVFRFQWARANAYLFATICLSLLVMERKTSESLRLIILQQDVTIWNLQDCIDKYITKQIGEDG